LTERNGFPVGGLVVTDIGNIAEVGGGALPFAKAAKSGAGSPGGTLFYVREGSLSLIVKQSKPETALRVRQGGVLYLPKGAPYRLAPSGGEAGCVSGVLVNFSCLADPGVEAFVVNPANACGVLEPDETDGGRRAARWQAVFAAMAAAWRARKPGGALRCMSLLYQALSMAEEQAAAREMPKARQASLENVVQDMEANLTNPEYSVESLAPVSGMCPTYFRQQFRRFYGVSPKQYLLNMRTRAARDLLAATTLSVTEIAKRTGFRSLYYFSKAFKGATGQSPREYREQAWG